MTIKLGLQFFLMNVTPLQRTNTMDENTEDVIANYRRIETIAPRRVILGNR